MSDEVWERTVTDELGKLLIANRAEDRQRIKELDEQLKEKGYVIRMFCAGCGAIRLVRDMKAFTDAHISFRNHARDHEGQKKSVLGEPMPTGHGWTDWIIAVKYLDET